MDIHKPKPWHGLREFLKEYVIIVVGVLTALGAEQAVEAVHTAQKASETEGLVREEFSRNLTFAQDRMMMSGCNFAMFRAVERALLTTPPDQPVPRLPYVFVYSRPFGWSQWEEAVATGVANHFPADRRRGYLRMYLSQGTAGSFNLLETREVELASTLRTLRMAPRRLDPVTREQLLQAVAQADWQEEWFVHNAGNVIAAGELLHLPAYRPSARARLATLADVKVCMDKVHAEEAGLPTLPASSE